MKLRDFIRSLVEDFKAHRRGEKRIAPRGTRGRIYAPKVGSVAADNEGMSFRVSKTPTAQLTMKITRANGDVETIVVPAQVTRNG
jgi:hypothetical protein